MAILTDYQEDADASELQARAIPPLVSPEASN